jgi:hypothetical protein
MAGNDAFASVSDVAQVASHECCVSQAHELFPEKVQGGPYRGAFRHCEAFGRRPSMDAPLRFRLTPTYLCKLYTKLVPTCRDALAELSTHA